MNSLDDLRTTLHDHAHDFDGLDPVSRSSGIRARIAGQRRRRNAVRGGIALAAVAAIVSGVVLTDLGSGRTIDPAADLGAPESFTALGWTYELADAVETDGSTQTISLPASERPYLISWKTAGDNQNVTVTSRTNSDSEPVDDSIWSSSAADWADHVVVEAKQAREITVSAKGGAVDAIAVATYEIDPTRIPAGKGSGQADAFHFRDRVADRVLVDAAVAEGRSEVRFDYTVPDGKVTLTHSCSGVPEGAWIQISLDGSDKASTFSEGCNGNSFDPGAGSHFSFDVPDGDWGREGTVRMWVSRSETDLTPVPASELAGTKLGVGLYQDTASKQQLWGTDVDTRLEASGHTWELVESADVDSGARLLLDSTQGAGSPNGPWLVQTAHDASSDGPVSLLVSAEGIQAPELSEIPELSLSSEGRGVAIMGSAILPPWARTVGIDVTQGADNVTRQALLLYRPVD